MPVSARKSSRTRFLLLPIVCALLALCACARPPTPQKQLIVWQTLGSWSGQGNVQTESFISGTGGLRVRWETKHETTPGAGIFKLTINSAISGRPIGVAVDRRGPGRDTAYLSDDPRTYYAVVESSNVDWSFTIEEGLSGTVEDGTK